MIDENYLPILKLKCAGKIREITAFFNPILREIFLNHSLTHFIPIHCLSEQQITNLLKPSVLDKKRTKWKIGI